MLQNTCKSMQPQKCVYTTQGTILCTDLSTGTPVYHPLKPVNQDNNEKK